MKAAPLVFAAAGEYQNTIPFSGDPRGIQSYKKGAFFSQAQGLFGYIVKRTK